MRMPWQRKQRPTVDAATHEPAVTLDVQFDLPAAPAPTATPTISVHDLQSSSGVYTNPNRRGALDWGFFDGDKFPGGFGPTTLLITDYWTLRQRSDDMFRRNLYARGLIRRLVTNEINTGLQLEAFPDEDILGFQEDALTEWSERVELRYGLWGSDPRVCDYSERMTWGELQETCRLEALIGGDVLVILRQSRRTRLPSVQLVNGGRIRTPVGDQRPNLPDGHRIVEGVRVDARGRHIGFYVQTGDDLLRSKFEYIPAYGPRTGRKTAWLVYGTDKRKDDVRGEPLLGLILQSLKDVDRYRDAALRKAVVNSIIAMSVEKNSDKPGSMPITGAATRRDNYIDDETGSAPREYNIAGMIPGAAIETLQEGETLKVHQSGAETQFGPFEEAMVQAIAWANQVPPEILRLAFSNNYSASQAAINEFKMYLNFVRTKFGHSFCQPIYQEWLISEALLGNVDAPGLLDAWRDPARYDLFGAWTSADWSGAIKPSTDIVKQAKGQQMLVAEGWSTNERAARETTGMKFRQNIKRLKRENQLKADAARPLAEFKQEFGALPDELGDPTAREDAAPYMVHDG